MEDLSIYTPTQLFKLLNDTKDDHEKLKNEVIEDTKKIDEIEIIINEKLKKITQLEKKYVNLIEEINKRKP